MLVIDCLKEFDHEVNEFIFSVSSRPSLLFKVQCRINHRVECFPHFYNLSISVVSLLFLRSDQLRGGETRSCQARDDTNLLSLMATGVLVVVAVVAVVVSGLAVSTPTKTRCYVTLPACLPACCPRRVKVGKIFTNLFSLPG